MDIDFIFIYYSPVLYSLKFDIDLETENMTVSISFDDQVIKALIRREKVVTKQSL